MRYGDSHPSLGASRLTDDWQNATETFETQELFVQNATLQLTPGDPFPSETAGTTSSPTSSATSSSTATNTAAAVASGSSSSSLSGGQIAGIAIGAAAVLVLAGALIYLCGRHSRADNLNRNNNNLNNRDTMNRNSFPVVGSMVDAKFGSPRSPGQDTFRSNPHYSIPPGNDPHQMVGYTPPAVQQYANGGSPPPPISPGSNPTYSTYQSMSHQVNSPLMAGMDGTQ